MTSPGSPHARFRRAIQRRSVLNAELAAREMGALPLEDALDLVVLYGEVDDPRYERAALRYLARYIGEGTGSLRDVALVAANLTERLPVRSRPRRGGPPPPG